MSDETPETLQNTTFLPLTLIGLAMILALVGQISTISRERAMVQIEKATQEQQLEQLKDARPRLEKIALGLLELAQKDPNASAIVAKHGITGGSPGQLQQAPPQ